MGGVPSLPEHLNKSIITSRVLPTLNAAGQRIKVEENNGRAVEYTYDDLYRLMEEKITDPVAGDRTINYTYDGVGNRVTCNDSSEGLTTYIYDDNGRLLSEALNGQLTTYTYDNNGNLLSRFKSDMDKATYTWDEENHLLTASVTDDGRNQQIEYHYDADGMRVASIVDGQETRYLLDANRPHAQVLEEYTPDGTVTASYTYGLNLVSQKRGSDRSFYHVDGLDSTRALTNAAGLVTDTYQYEAYGDLLESIGNTVNHYLFTGEQYDPNLEQYYLRARYYDSETGRFSTTDPFEGMLVEPLSLAKYPYVHGNPVNLTDPTGLLVHGTSTSMKIVTILAAMQLVSPLSIGNLKRYDEDDVVVPGYLKQISHAGVGKFINLAITGNDYQVIRRKVKECNTTMGAGNCDLEGFPIIVWGDDVPEITQHTQEGIAKTGQSFLARIYPGWNKWARPASPRGSGGPRSWYNAVEGSCQWIQGQWQPQFQGRNCDEYPYNSTLQGGPLNYERGKVSLKLVDYQQNRKQGEFILSFYTLAPVPSNHPKESWFGVKISMYETYWIDRGGNMRDINHGSPWLPF